MNNSTTNIYDLKRKFLNFSNKISNELSKPEQRFFADMTYGQVATLRAFSQE